MSTQRIIEDTIVTTIAAVCRIPAHRVTTATPLLDFAMDSLTLVAVLTQIEAALEMSFAPDDVSAALNARLVTDLARVVARRLAAAAAQNSTQSRD